MSLAYHTTKLKFLKSKLLTKERTTQAKTNMEEIKSDNRNNVTIRTHNEANARFLINSIPMTLLVSQLIYCRENANGRRGSFSSLMRPGLISSWMESMASICCADPTSWTWRYGIFDACIWKKYIFVNFTRNKIIVLFFSYINKSSWQSKYYKFL